MIKSVGGGDPADAVLDAARRRDAASTTTMLGPVRLVGQADGSEVFDASWTAGPAVRTLDLVRRGYLAPELVRSQGRLTPAVQLLVERIADFIMGGPEHVEPR